MALQFFYDQRTIYAQGTPGQPNDYQVEDIDLSGTNPGHNVLSAGVHVFGIPSPLQQLDHSYVRGSHPHGWFGGSGGNPATTGWRFTFVRHATDDYLVELHGLYDDGI